MAKHGSKLRRALDNFQGKDYAKLKQKEQRKEARSRKAKESGEQVADPALAKSTTNGTKLAESRQAKRMEADIERLDGTDGTGEEEAEEDEEDEEDNNEGEGNGALSAFDIMQLDESSSDDDDGADDSEEAEDGVEDDIPLSDIEDAGSGDDDIVPHQRLTINNTAALERAVASIALPISKLPFSEHQSITTSEPVVIEDVEDDLNRELTFYAQCLSAVKEGRSRLRKEGVAFSRPPDFFAEMVKSDEHMGKIKGKLVADAAGKKASQDARKQRELKKFGKQVQQERLKERAKDKRDMLDKVNLLKRKRQGAGLETANEEDGFDVALEDAAETARKDRQERRAKGGPANAKRQKKDEKYGFGGKKRHAKSNDAASSADMKGFSTRKMKASSRTAAVRPGKGRRMKARMS